jgi:hypothetical protein
VSSNHKHDVMMLIFHFMMYVITFTRPWQVFSMCAVARLECAEQTNLSKALLRRFRMHPFS